MGAKDVAQVLNARLPHRALAWAAAPPRMLACHTGLGLGLQHHTSQAEWGISDPGIQKVHTGVSRIQRHPQLLHTESDATLGLMRICHKYRNIIKENKTCEAVEIQSYFRKINSIQVLPSNLTPL